MEKQTKQNEIIKKDDSTIEEKYDSLIKARIAKRTRNTFNQKILTLESDREYIRLLVKPKYRYATRSEKNPIRHQKVLTDYFKDNEKNIYVLQSNYSLEQHYVLAGKTLKSFPDMSVAMYVTINDNIRKENGKNNTQLTTSESILLSRFDPGQQFDHINRIDNNSLKFKYFGGSIKSHVPHFHYASRSQALAYNGTADCDAISLDDLIRYVFDLNKIKRSSELLYDDMSMPYLQIKFNPNLYQTNSKILKLGDCIPQNYLLKKSFIFGLIDKRADLFGLEAVLFDLILLRAMVKFCEEEKNANNFTNYPAILHEITIKLASKIALAGLNDDLNNDLIDLVSEMREISQREHREF